MKVPPQVRAELNSLETIFAHFSFLIPSRQMLLESPEGLLRLLLIIIILLARREKC